MGQAPARPLTDVGEAWKGGASWPDTEGVAGPRGQLAVILLQGDLGARTPGGHGISP